LSGEFRATRNGGRIISHQDAEEIFLLLDAPFLIGNLRRSCVN